MIRLKLNDENSDIPVKFNNWTLDSVHTYRDEYVYAKYTSTRSQADNMPPAEACVYAPTLLGLSDAIYGAFGDRHIKHDLRFKGVKMDDGSFIGLDEEGNEDATD